MADFSHVANFTDYMRIVDAWAGELLRPGERVLDLPAGNGLLSQRMAQRGLTVVSADINEAMPEFVRVDMSAPLPFADGEFAGVVCLEGVEHVTNPAGLIAELARVLAPGGVVMVSTPNITSLYSRLTYLTSGVLYQFDPEYGVHPGGRSIDRGHVSPMSLQQLDYHFSEHGLELIRAGGDRIKKKLLLPVYALLWACDAALRRLRCRRTSDLRLRRLYRHMGHPRVLMSRSLVAAWRRPQAT